MKQSLLVRGSLLTLAVAALATATIFSVPRADAAGEAEGTVASSLARADTLRVAVLAGLTPDVLAAADIDDRQVRNRLVVLRQDPDAAASRLLAAQEALDAARRVEMDLRTSLRSVSATDAGASRFALDRGIEATATSASALEAAKAAVRSAFLAGLPRPSIDRVDELVSRASLSSSLSAPWLLAVESASDARRLEDAMARAAAAERRGETAREEHRDREASARARPGVSSALAAWEQNHEAVAAEMASWMWE